MLQKVFRVSNISKHLWSLQVQQYRNIIIMTQPNYYGSGKKKRRRGGKKNKKYQQYNNQQQNYHQQSHNDEYKQQSKSTDDDLLVIDGSIMEGGGQILRNSTAFAALMKTSIHITKIRGKRSTPGLRKQHSKGIELVSKINGLSYY